MSLFPTADGMREMTGPIVADAAEQLGSRCSYYALVEVKELNASTNIDFATTPIADLSVRLKELTNLRAREIFGQNSNVTMRGSMTRSSSVMKGGVLIVTEGDFLARQLEIVEIIEKPLSDAYILGLVDYEGEHTF